MKLGIVTLWRPGDLDGFRHEVRTAEASGADLVAVGDTQSLFREVYASLAVVAAHTSSCLIGPMVTNPVTRHPAVTASAIAAIDELSGGRAVLGIGTGGSAVWALEERPATLADFRDYLTTLRDLFDSGVATHGARRMQVQGLERPVPIVVTAEGPRTLQLAGALADGVVLHTGTSPQAVEWCRTQITRGAEAAGRDPAQIELWMMLKAAVDEDVESALEDAKVGLAGSARHALQVSPAEKGVPEDLLEPVRQLVDRYDPTSHAKAVSRNAELVDELGLAPFLAEQFGLIGPPHQCADRLRALEALGIQGVVVPAITADPLRQIERLGREVMPLVNA